MGSVIVMVECNGVVVKVWLVPNLQLYIFGSSEDELAALLLQRSGSVSKSERFEAFDFSYWVDQPEV